MRMMNKLHEKIDAFRWSLNNHQSGSVAQATMKEIPEIA